MGPAKQNLTIYQGDDYALECRFSTAAGPVDLTGHTFAAQIRATTADADADGPLAEFDCTLSDAVGGIVTVSLDHDVTASLKVKSSAWDLQGTNAAGLVTTYLAGSVALTLEVTR